MHKYKLVDESGVDEGRQRIPAGFFDAKVEGSTTWLRDCVSFQATPGWYSPKPESWPELAADMDFCLFADRTGAWREVQDLWLRMLFRSDRLLFRERGSAQWYFAVHVVGNEAVVGWPAVVDAQAAIDRKPHTFARPSPDGECAWFFITDESRWEGLQFSWYSPLHIALLKRGSRALAQHLDTVAVRAVAVGRPRPIVEICAECAFESLSKPVLRKLAARLRIDIPSRCGAYEAVSTMVKQVLRIDDGPRLFDIMKQRVESTMPNIDLLLEVDEAVAVLDKDDQEELRKKQDESKKKLAAQRQIVVGYTVARQTYRVRQAELATPGQAPKRRRV